ncbi:MAG TPA: DoxX family protein [Candidatus Chromulinivoraceae bacterium]|nr:DoxX family protein [Candidatus Chromulinivoraceae bacterium]
MIQAAKNISTKTLSKHTALLRIAFGFVWLINAAFKWNPSFRDNFLDQATSAAQGQPDWLSPWFQFWTHILSYNPHLFAISIAVIETLLALALIFGFARRTVYLLAAVFCLLIWAIPEGFGGPYTNTSTDVGAGIIYVVVFLALYGLDRLAHTAAWSIDQYITKRLTWWAIIANP